jgi:hypothetical protein
VGRPCFTVANNEQRALPFILNFEVLERNPFRSVLPLPWATAVHSTIVAHVDEQPVSASHS